ncbi:very low-density lipoprotein receptor-like [Actinia tenebrosa]|uniref:Very low-density lipoprotein receptor-like n=1 Tax=Actinia tenebrosa TaxID=6105 RepID=A0A6P8HSX2_ACTTE|nr:very low-density lipoprotein receptor-like [Actinia tenebrosa]
MYGSGMGTLRMLVQVDGNNTEVWKVGGNHGDGWIRGKYDFAAQKNNNKNCVIFEAARGPTYTSDIALDDISFTDRVPPKPGTCNRDQFKCRSGECIKSSFVCNNVGDCSDRSDEEYCPNGKCSLKEIYCPAEHSSLPPQ